MLPTPQNIQAKTMVTPNHFNEIIDILIRAWKTAFNGQKMLQGLQKSEQSVREAMEKCEFALLGLSHARNNDLYARAKELELFLHNLYKNRIWDEKLFNIHDTYISIQQNLVNVSCNSVESTLSTDVNVYGSPISHSEGQCFAWLGVKFQIAGIQVWNYIKNKQVRISTTIDYTFSGEADPENPKFQMSAGVNNSVSLIGGGAIPLNPNVTQNIDSLNQPGNVSMMHVTNSITTTLDSLGTGIPGQCEILVLLTTGAYGNDGGVSHSIGEAVVTNIQLMWV